MALLKYLIDIIYPPRCHICGEFLDSEDSLYEKRRLLICDRCFMGLPFLHSPKCPICSVPLPDVGLKDHLCERCIQRPPYFTGIYSPFIYKNGLRDAIHEMKYNGKPQIGKTLGKLLSLYLDSSILKSPISLVIPVPLHTKRLKSRGYNQSIIIARCLSQTFHVDLDFTSLIRSVNTDPQVELPMDRRRKNVKNAFSVINKENIRGREVVLVDDVATTGSTLNECSRVLRKAGARRVFCVVVARAGFLTNP